MKIKSFSIDHYRCLRNIRVDCSRPEGGVYQWTVLLGENNTGKTNVLRALALLEPMEYRELVVKDESTPSSVPVAYNMIMMKEMGDDPNYVVQADFEPDEENLSERPWSYTHEAVSRLRKARKNLNFRTFAYGVSRYPARAALSERESAPYETLFSTSARLLDFQEWILQLDYSAKHDSELAEKRLAHLRKLLGSGILPNVTDFECDKVGDNDQVAVLFKMGNDRRRFEELGFGYQTTLTWLADLCKRLFDAYPDSPNPLREEAVVLIDELDLHLHPRWQRDLVPTLTRLFPNVQFIVTTHSPHVLQSMGEVNLHLLLRGEDGTVTAERVERTDFRGWTVEEILQETMEMGDAVRSDELNEAFEAFDAALDARDPAKAEEVYRRLDAILHRNNALRRMIDVQLAQLKRRCEKA